jgi:hypothetical protein
MNFFHIKKGRREEDFRIERRRLASNPRSTSSAADAAGRALLAAPAALDDAAGGATRRVASNRSPSFPPFLLDVKKILGAASVAALAATSMEVRAEPQVLAVDGEGRVAPLGETWASIERTPPKRAPKTAPDGDPDALRYLLVGTELPRTLRVESFDARGKRIGRLTHVPLAGVACPEGSATGERCAITPPIRVAADRIDAVHPLVKRRSLVGELGGTLRVGGAAIRVLGPRSAPAGPIERLRGKLRFVVVRSAPGGALPVGDDEEEAREIAGRAAERVNALWSACGISFGPEEELAFTVADPPPPFLVAVGCDHGLPASGGELRVRIAAPSAAAGEISVTVDAGMLPAEAARRLAGALRRSGLDVDVFDNPAIAAGAFGTSDLLLRGPDGAYAEVDRPATRGLSTDATLSACIGHVNLEDGLSHFSDVDASAGTLEERTLVRALDDGDPTTIDIYLVGAFAGGGRIGESFIASDGGQLKNLVIVDRAGLAGAATSFALAHELGHVLLDDPGHPDDFGDDHPEKLMDSDAADGSAFGPRRLGLDECARAVLQSGPDAPIPLLAHWPLAPE